MLNKINIKINGFSGSGFIKFAVLKLLGKPYEGLTEEEIERAKKAIAESKKPEANIYNFTLRKPYKSGD